MLLNLNMLLNKILESVLMYIKPVKTVTFSNDLIDGDEYRFESDPRHVVRIKQKQPNGFPNLLRENVAISDLNNKIIRKNIESFISGNEREILLMKSMKASSHTRLAIGRRKDKRCKRRRGFIGSLPHELCEDLSNFSPNAPIEASLKTIIKRKNNNNSLVKIDVWSPIGVEVISNRLYGRYPN